MDDIVINPEFFDCTLPAGETFIHRTDPSYTAFLYVIGGKGNTDGKRITDGMLVLYNAGEQIAVSAASEGLRVLLLTGKPLNEPVAWGGPIVMNTQEEVDAAMREYREGRFIKHSP